MSTEFFQGSATGQQADAMSTPFVGPSVMDGDQSDLARRGPSNKSFSQKGRSSHASDAAGAQALARNTWDRVSLLPI